MAPFTLFEYLLHIQRAVRSRATRIAGKLMLRGLNVEYGSGLVLKGMPIVRRAPGSTIKIGKDVMMISSASDTALGVNHAIKMETLTSGASLTIEDEVKISGGTICAQLSVHIGPRTMLGANVTIVDTDFHPLAATRRWLASDDIQAKPVAIGANVFLGTNAIVLRGVEIGDNTVVGAGSVVTRSLPANAIAAGNPCRVIRFFSDEEIRQMDPGSMRDITQLSIEMASAG